MLNFDNARAVTGKMLVDSRKYVEMVIQKALDHCICYKSDTPRAIIFAAKSGMAVTEGLEDILNEEDEEDLYDFFEDLHNFDISYNCYGEITFQIDNENDKNSALFRLISECLLTNGFTCHKSNRDTTYKICLKDVPSAN